MPHLTHLQGNLLPRVPQSECMACKIQTSTQTLQGSLTQKGRYIRIQDKGSERALKAGQSHGYISGMTNFTHATVSKFEQCMRRIADHIGEAPTR